MNNFHYLQVYWLYWSIYFNCILIYHKNNL